MPSHSGISWRQGLRHRVCVWRAGPDLDTRLAANNTEPGRNAGCLGLKQENQAHASTPLDYAQGKPLSTRLM